MLSICTRKSLTFSLNIILFFVWTVQVEAHAGHKHAKDDPNIKVPAVVARVNGKDISSQYVLGNLKQYIRHQKNAGHDVTPALEKAEVKRLIDSEIGRELLLQHADHLGIKATSELLDKKINAIKAKFKSDQQFEEALKKRKATVEKLKHEFKPDVLVDAVIEKEILPHIKIDPKKVEEFYEKNKRLYWEEEKVRASVILRKIDSSKGSQAEEIAKKELEDISEYAEKGANFDELARKSSQDSLAKKGGDLGYFSRGKMLAAFSEKAFSMKVGEISPTFKTHYGLHILKVTGKKPGGFLSFEVVKKSIKEKIRKQMIKKQTEIYIHDLRKKADVKVYF
jgi:parvulin-like peptidyl-prolyl isomerase